LSAFSRQQGVTLFITLLTAFKTLLYRYTAQEDIVVGTSTDGRNRVELENLIGFFVNTLVLRSDFSGNPTFREMLGRIREVALEAYAHQDLSFEKLVEELQPERSVSISPLFQVTFRFQGLNTEAFELQGLTATAVELDSGIAKFDLALAVREGGGGLRTALEYNTSLFDATTIDRMLGHYRNLLEQIVENPDQPVSAIELMTEAERQRLLVQWNDTQKDYRTDKCLHQLFEEQAEKTPGSIAAVFEDHQLTYLELNSRANQLARHLQKKAVNGDAVVGSRSSLRPSRSEVSTRTPGVHA
jgi:non-ribosomal peptide synthetase component F